MKILISWRNAMSALFAVILLAAFPFLLIAQDNTAESGYAIIKLTSPAAVHYRGGIKNLPATAVENGGRFDPNSTAYAAYRKHLESEQAKFVAAMGRAAPQAVAVRSFHATANAVVVELNGLSPGQLKKISGAKDVYESRLIQMDMNESVSLVNAPAAWAMVGGQENAGEGVRVGVIDSGNTNSLIPGFQPFFNCKDVEFGGFFFSGVTGSPAIGIKNENGVDPAPGVAYVSDHGTHVAGTVGGCIHTISGGPWEGTTLSGVAPGATLVDYNVFPGIGAGYVAFGGSAFSHDIAAAIETSVLNGDHVINMSLGGGVQGPHDFLAEAANAAVAAGVVVVTSNGNSGPGYFTAGSPGTAAYVISVGATTNTRGLGLLVMAPGFEPMNAFGGEFPNFDGSDETLIDWPGSDNLACSGDGAVGLSGEVVLIERGACSFSQKMANAKAAGAGGVIVFTDNRAPGGMAKTPGFDDDIPAVMIGRADGLALEAELDLVGNLSPTVITPPTPVPTTPNELAGFSSRGPAAFTGIIKPDMVAPGVNILSSVFSGFELFNGTSMASPHVAGASAVVLQQHPEWTPMQVKSALTTTATDLGLEVWEQGSGLLDIEAALGANAHFWPTNASFGTFQGNKPANGSIDISIDSGVSCTVDSITNDTYVSATIGGSTLTVNFDGGRAAPSDLHGGNVFVDCAGQSHTIPWGAVVDR